MYNDILAISNQNDDLFDYNPENANLVTQNNSSKSSTLFYYADMPRTISSKDLTSEVIKWNYTVFDKTINKFSDTISSGLGENIYSLGGYFIYCTTGLTLGTYVDAAAKQWKNLCGTIRTERTRPDGSIIEHTGPNCIPDQLIFSLDGGAQRPNVPNSLFQDPNFKVYARRVVDGNKEEERSCFDCISRGEHRLPKNENNDMSSYCKANYIDYFYVTHIAILDKQRSVETGQKTLKWLSIPEANINCIEDGRRFVLNKPFFVVFDRWSSYYGRKSEGHGQYDIQIQRADYLPAGALTYRDYKLYLQNVQNFGKYCVVSKVTNANTYPAFTEVYFSPLQAKEGTITHMPMFYHNVGFMESKGYTDFELVKMAFVTAGKMVGLQGVQPSEEDLEGIPIINNGKTSEEGSSRLEPAVQNQPEPTSSIKNSAKSLKDAFSKQQPGANIKEANNKMVKPFGSDEPPF